MTSYVLYLLLALLLMASFSRVGATTPKRKQPLAEVIGMDERKDLVRIAQSKKRRWKVDERVCFPREGKGISCGTVILSTTTEATVRLTAAPRAKPVVSVSPEPAPPISSEETPIAEKELPAPWRPSTTIASEPPVVSATTPVVPPTPSPSEKTPPRVERARKVAQSETSDRLTLPLSVNREKEVTPSGWLLGGGIIAGLGYFFTELELHYAVNPSVAISLMPVFSSGSVGTVQERMVGTLFNVDLYLSRSALNGAFARVGGGAYRITVESGSRIENGISPTVLLLLGVREPLSPAITLSLGAGAQYVWGSKEITLIDFSGALPLVLLEVAYAF